MSRATDINRLKSLPLEERAKQEKIELSCGVQILILLCGLIPGLYYWIFDEFIFEYYSISPFGGFLIFTISGFVICAIVTFIFSQYWKGFNTEIDKSNDCVKKIIDQGVVPAPDLFRMKKEYIERNIGQDRLTDDEFEWHSSRYCWGCGEMHTVPPKEYTFTHERTEKWKDGIYWYSKTFSESANIKLCPKCYDRLSKANHAKNENEDIITMVVFMLCGLVMIITFTVTCIVEIRKTGTWWPAVGYGLLSSLLSLGIAFSAGKIIIVPFAALIGLPFMNTKENSKTKWSLLNIPKILRFRKRNLPHTH